MLGRKRAAPSIGGTVTNFGIVATGVVRNPGSGSGPGGEWFATSPEFWARVPLPVIAWQLWYADGSTVRSADREWFDAPVNGVQVLMVYHADDRRTIVKGRDEYTLPGESASKLGQMIDRERFEKIQQEAIADSWRP